MSGSARGGSVQRSLIVLFHSFCATVGVMSIVGIAALVLPPWTDDMTEIRSGINTPPAEIQHLAHALFWTGMVLLGFLVGWGVNRLLNSKSAKWAWVLPVSWLAVLVIWEISGSSGLGEGGKFHFAWRAFTAQDPDEGIISVFSTCPALTSIGYALGAWVAFKGNPSEDNIVPKAQNS